MKKYINGALLPLLMAGCLASNVSASTVEGGERLDEYTKLTKALVTVENIYVDEIEFRELVDKTIDGLLANLDSHSMFMDKERFKTFTESTNGGDFGGIGISVGTRDKILTIIAPIEDTPGEKAGLKSGDKIVKIDGVSCIDYSLEEAVSKMRGKPGSKITLTILRKGVEGTLDFEIEREIIKVKSVKSKYLAEDNIAYIRVTSFDKNVVDLVGEELQRYPEARGFVLDLRNNPGGLLNQAVGLVDLFVDEGDILEQRGRTEDNNMKFWARKGNTYSSTLPLVVLVNGGSASASEIVSGSLQDHKRAVIVGKQTFGKGSVQAVIPFSEGEAMKVTVARYYLPSGRTIQAKGVIPDIEVNEGEVVKEKTGAMEIKEKDLKNHLQVDEYIKKEKEASRTQDGREGELLKKEDLLKDNQLNTAFNVIKALLVVKGI